VAEVLALGRKGLSNKTWQTQEREKEDKGLGCDIMEGKAIQLYNRNLNSNDQDVQNIWKL
jgi:hypothetical protein